MAETSLSLLGRLQEIGAADDWQRLVALYTPLLQSWLRRSQVNPADAEDLIQEVLGVVVRKLGDFEHNRRTGAFRLWLRTILVNRLRGFWRNQAGKPQATGDSAALQLLDQLEDPQSGLTEEWERDHDRQVMAKLLEQVQTQVAPQTWAAFRAVALQGRDEESVAQELGMTVNAVYVAKCRVLARLRREAEGLIA